MLVPLSILRGACVLVSEFRSNQKNEGLPMHSRTIAHVMCFAMFTFGTAGAPAWSFTSDGNLTSSCLGGSC